MYIVIYKGKVAIYKSRVNKAFDCSDSKGIKINIEDAEIVKIALRRRIMRLSQLFPVFINVAYWPWQN